ITSSGVLTATAGINNNNAGITNTGAISGATNVTASGTITLSGLTTNGPVYTTTGGVLASEAQLAPVRGGTGLDTSAAGNGKLLIGNGTGFTLTNLSTGTGISVTNGAGSITINNTGVTSLTGTANQVNV